MQRFAEERGAVMVMGALTLTVLMLFAGLALDFGRAHLLRAQLQSAVDAAALAGALEVVPMVELSIDRWVRVSDICTDPVSGKPYRCSSWEEAAPVSLTGPAWDLLHLGLWRTRVGANCTWPYRCDSSPDIVREWLILPQSTISVAENTFYKNALWSGSGSRIDSLTVAMDPVQVEVTATAQMTLPTSFLRLAGIRELQIARTGSAVPVRR